jgi:hypothetical protein
MHAPDNMWWLPVSGALSSPAEVEKKSEHSPFTESHTLLDIQELERNPLGPRGR